MDHIKPGYVTRKSASVGSRPSDLGATYPSFHVKLWGMQDTKLKIWNQQR